jgi:pimeloyl-ACP methyl ester carboxylesterase
VTLARLRRRLLQAAAIVGFFILAGATYQGVATALERRQFPHPGQLTDVGGHQLHLYCTGQGTPTVVLEASAAGMSAEWAAVQPAIASTTRVCSYDRAGLGWSEAGDGPFEPAQVSEQLRQLLAGAGQQPPFVLAGHGFGAALARLHVRRFGADAVGLVLIDAPTGPAPSAGDPIPMVSLSPWLARAGILRATSLLSGRAADLPEPWNGAMMTFLHRPDHLTRASGELERWDEIVAEAARVPLGDDLRVEHVEATGSARVAFVTAPAEAAKVTDALRAMIDAVRRGEH